MKSFFTGAHLRRRKQRTNLDSSDLLIENAPGSTNAIGRISQRKST
jgi:hypothetical protein